MRYISNAAGLIDQNIAAEFEAVPSPNVGDGIRVLLAVDGGLTRAKRVASHRERLPGEAHDPFGIDAVRLARLAVPLITELRYIDQNRI